MATVPKLTSQGLCLVATELAPGYTSASSDRSQKSDAAADSGAAIAAAPSALTPRTSALRFRWRLSTLLGPWVHVIHVVIPKWITPPAAPPRPIAFPAARARVGAPARARGYARHVC